MCSSDPTDGLSNGPNGGVPDQFATPATLKVHRDNCGLICYIEFNGSFEHESSGSDEQRGGDLFRRPSVVEII